MKKLIIIITAVLLVNAITVMAQGKMQVSEVSDGMSQGTQKGLAITIFGTSVKDVEKLWKKEMKNNKGKVGNEKGDVFADDAKFKNISENTIDIYATFKEVSEGTKMTVFFNLGGAYISSSKHPEEYKAAEKIIYSFAVSAAKNAVAAELAIAEKLLEQMGKDQGKLEKEATKLKGEIEDCKQTIQTNEGQLTTNGTNQETKKKEIVSQTTLVEKVKEKMANVK